MFRKILVIVAILSCSGGLFAQEDGLKAVEANLKKANPNFASSSVIVVRELSSEKLPGLYEARIDGQSLVVTKDGTRAIVGDVFDLQLMVNLTKTEKQKGQVGLVQNEIAKLNDEDFVIYPASTKKIGELYVFSDTTCGYCRKLHQEIADYQTAGIEVKYIPYPRSALVDGEAAFENLKQVMCAADKPMAMTKIKAGTDRGEFIKDSYAEACVESVRKGQMAGRNVGLEGTPFMYLSKGAIRIVPGYQPSESIISLFKK